MTTPWIVVLEEGSPECVSDAEGFTICYCYGTGDAALIVAAVNAHDALLDVARAAKGMEGEKSMRLIAALSRLPEGTI